MKPMHLAHSKTRVGCFTLHYFPVFTRYAGSIQGSRKGFSNSWLVTYSSKICPRSTSAGLSRETVHNLALNINVYWAASMQ